MRFKSGVDIQGIRPEIAAVLPLLKYAVEEFGAELVITSGRDGRHSRTSLHYDGAAIDFRSRDLSSEDQVAVADMLRERLPKHFDLVLESTHFHLEWQPKRPENHG